MKCEFKAGDLTFSVEGDSPKTLMEQLSTAQEVFSQKMCGVCKNPDLRYMVREVDGNNFYEVVCQDLKCRAKFQFGQHKKGDTLFPKRKDTEGNYIANNGWVKWDGEKKEKVEKTKK